MNNPLYDTDNSALSRPGRGGLLAQCWQVEQGQHQRRAVNESREANMMTESKPRPRVKLAETESVRTRTSRAGGRWMKAGR